VEKEIKRILKVFEKHGLFEEGVLLIGSWCFQLYQKHLEVPAFPLLTQDVDFLIPNPFKGEMHRDFIDDLKALGFMTEHRRDGSLYLWNTELKIEFITPEKGRGVERAILVKSLGFRAIPLRFVNFLLDDFINIKDDGVNIAVPNPVNFCLHKILIVSRRRNLAKGLKDLQHAVHTFSKLDHQQFLKAFKKLPRKWQLTIERTLLKARSQDPLLEEQIDRMIFTLQSA